MQRPVPALIRLLDMILNFEFPGHAGKPFLEQFGEAVHVLDIVADDTAADQIAAFQERVFSPPFLRGSLPFNARKSLDPDAAHFGAHQGSVLDRGNDLGEDRAELSAGAFERRRPPVIDVLQAGHVPNSSSAEQFLGNRIHRTLMALGLK